MIVTVVSVTFVALLLIWRHLCWGGLLISDSDNKTTTLNSISMRPTTKLGEDNLGYGSLKDTTSNDPPPMSLMASSASQHSLNRFVTNKNTSRLCIDQNHLLVNYSILVSEVHRTLRLNLISLENLKSSNSELKILEKLNVYIKIELVYVKEGMLGFF